MSSETSRSTMLSWCNTLLRRSATPLQGQLVAVGSVLGTAFLGYGLTISPVFGGGIRFIAFSPAILIASVLGGLSGGLSALILASLVAAHFWFDPAMRSDLSVESWEKLATFWLFSGLLITIGTLLRVLVRALADSEDQANIRAHEMTHRIHNILGLVQAISRQTFRTASTPDEFKALFEARLVALGRAQELVADHPTLPTDLETLLALVLEPFEILRFNLAGPPTGVPPGIASTLALLIHELGTNSVKYGALSVPEGEIAITWIAEGHRTRVDWREMNGPPVVAPLRAGFGSRLLKTAFPPAYGETSITFGPAGVHCRIQFSAVAT